jgi:hypothetical protein
MEKILRITLAGMMALAAAPAQAAPVGAVAAGTPVWVYAVLALLIYNGLALTRTRAVPLWRLLIQPAVFIGWGMVSLALAAPTHPILLADWFALAALGGALGLATTRSSRWSTDRESGAVRVAGSILPLARSLAIFAVKYALAVAAALHLAAPAALIPWDMAVSGASAG